MKNKIVALEKSPKNIQWKHPVVIALISYYFSMVLIGLWIPENIFQKYPNTRAFSDFMAGIVPQINSITAMNIKPDVNRFYFSALWALSPIGLLIMIASIFEGRKNNARPDPNVSGLWLTIGWIFGAYTCYLAIAGKYFDAQNRLSWLLFGNDLGRAFVAQLVFCTGLVTFVIPGLVLIIWHYIFKPS